jgi:pSer/pThr/pTyr-binding forkhead associated (FHA) protein
MSLPLLLLALRCLAALLLLAFLGLVVWLVFQDMRLTAAAVARQGQTQGHLRVVANTAEQPAVGTIFPLLPVTRLGRAASSTIVLDEGYVSMEHALIVQRGRQWLLEDLGSRNGTLLNEVLVSPGETAVVSSGDVVGIGSVRFRLVLNEDS